MPSTVTSTETMKALQALQAKKPSSPKALQTSMEPSIQEVPKSWAFRAWRKSLAIRKAPPSSGASIGASRRVWGLWFRGAKAFPNPEP